MDYTALKKCLLKFFFSPSEQYAIQYLSHFRLREISFTKGDTDEAHIQC